ncbi:MAG: gene transfer agent family protein [Oscillospiraceae bacterium]|jgi:hypothetical protein|nr:gene transfer agent family protein [Oscillospiraceae bacterium]
MIYLKVNDTQYPLSTTLGTAAALEKEHKLPLPEMFAKISESQIGLLIDVLACGHKRSGEDADEAAFRAAILEGDLDYHALENETMRFVAQLLFSGTSKEQGEKVDASGLFNENAKNLLRGLLGLPTVHVQPTQTASPETT